VSHSPEVETLEAKDVWWRCAKEGNNSNLSVENFGSGGGRVSFNRRGIGSLSAVDLLVLYYRFLRKRLEIPSRLTANWAKVPVEVKVRLHFMFQLSLEIIAIEHHPRIFYYQSISLNQSQHLIIYTPHLNSTNFILF
jgi:hypothetical protein